MQEKTKPSPFNFNRFTVFKERGFVFITVTIILLLTIISFAGYCVINMILDNRFPFPK